ncbi:hypothetical protein JHK87_050151 [Glycine soja]|nr:hypothetical protein JHK87_050151 [Glycine soja]
MGWLSRILKAQTIISFRKGITIKRMRDAWNQNENEDIDHAISLSLVEESESKQQCKWSELNGDLKKRHHRMSFLLVNRVQQEIVGAIHIYRGHHRVSTETKLVKDCQALGVDHALR